MRTIVVNNQKGGVGKTTIALHLAWHYVEQDARVLFIDLDAQGNATETLKRSCAADGRWTTHPAGVAADLFGNGAIDPHPTARLQILTATTRLNVADASLEPSLASIRSTFPPLKPHFDICVIDTPPAFGARNLGALLISDHLLAPVQLEDYAMSGVNELLKSIAVAEKLRGARLDFLGLLPSQFRANSVIHRRHLELLVARLGGTDLVVPGFITLRQAYAEAVARSIPAWAIRDNSAAALAGREIRHVLSGLAERIGRS